MSSVRLFSAYPRGGIGIDAEVAIERDAVVLLRRLTRNIAARDVVAHPADVALKGIARASAAGELDREEIVAFEQQARDLGRQRAFSAATGVQHRLRGARGLGTEHAERGKFEAVHAQIHTRFLGQNSPLTAHAEAAAKRPYFKPVKMKGTVPGRMMLEKIFTLEAEKL